MNKQKSIFNSKEGFQYEDETHLLNFRESMSDPVYGIRLIDGCKFALGDSRIIFKNGFIYVQNKRFRETPGLRELLFKKRPKNNYTDQDLKNYKLLLMLTSAHKYGNDCNRRIKANKGYKYRNIISILFFSPNKFRRKVNNKEEEEDMDDDDDTDDEEDMDDEDYTDDENDTDDDEEDTDDEDDTDDDDEEDTDG